jgi:polyphosphate kinase
MRDTKKNSSKKSARTKLDPISGEPIPEIDLGRSELYLNRELTWLSFCRHVLSEARDERNRLLERMKFLAIVGSNLDEFFMKRIGGLKQQVAAGVGRLSADGLTPAEQIDQCLDIVAGLDVERGRVFSELRRQLREHGIRIANINRVTRAEREQLREVYLREIHPLVTPQAMDPAHPFPFVSNLSLNLLVTLRYEKEKDLSLARVKVPVGAGIPRLLRPGESEVWVPLEEVMADNLDLLFPGMIVESFELFRVTRNANTERDEEEADDLLALIESELRDRRLAPVVRMEVAEGMSPEHVGLLTSELGLSTGDVHEVDGFMAMADLHQIAALDRPDLRDPPHRPVDHAELPVGRNIFHTIRETSTILLQHPYESFTSSVERFLHEAANDPKVRAIKMTLYRTSAETRVIDYLIEAAQNGKQVAVVVELKARFDEHSNIQWASRLEEFGIHVTYGVVGLKTHCKVILVVRQDFGGLRRYAHIGTGNYHSGTARQYSDLGLLTSDEGIGEDLTELFNYLTTGYKPRRRYQKLLVAPTILKQGILTRIAAEIEHHRAGRPSGIRMKMNALEDVDVTRALYEAASAGVPIDLLVRDTCRLRPGIAGLSESVRVVSVVGRFLEHARILVFEGGGSPEYWIGSADCMERNLESRVEVMCPVGEERHRRELDAIFELQLADRRCGWRLDAKGDYRPSGPESVDGSVDSQEVLVERAEKRRKASSRLRKRKPKGVARRASL